jgi:ABC-type siderophore export system fused ATPase/permease subunit
LHAPAPVFGFIGLAMGLYILGLKTVQTKLARMTLDIFFDKRMKWIEKSVSNAQGKFGDSDRGAVLSALNNYTCYAENSANFYVMLITCIVKFFAVLLYLSIVTFWAVVGTLGGIIVIAALYYIMVQKVQVYFEKSRDTRDMYLMRLLNGLPGKKKEYVDDDMEKYTDEFRSNTVPANVKFINAFVICEMVLVAFLGAICFAVPRLFPQITTFTLMCFIMAFLYLIGPINSLLGAIPNIMQLKMTWNHVKELTNFIDK